MGYAIAEAAQARGAQVVLVTGPTALPVPAGVEVVPVVSAEEMTKAITTRLAWSTVVVMAAAVADFRPKDRAQKKWKKLGRKAIALDLEPTTDILTTLSTRRDNQLLVGFAAETNDLIANASEKLRRKGLDLIVANDVTRAGAGFGSDHNAATLIDRHGTVAELPLKPKRRLADDILDAAQRLFRKTGRRRPETAERGGL